MADSPQPTPADLGYPFLVPLCRRCGRELVYDSGEWGCDGCGEQADLTDWTRATAAEVERLRTAFVGSD